VVVDDQHARHPTVTSCGFTIVLTHGNTYQNSPYRIAAAATSRISTRTHQGPGRIDHSAAYIRRPAGWGGRPGFRGPEGGTPRRGRTRLCARHWSSAGSSLSA